MNIFLQEAGLVEIIFFSNNLMLKFRKKKL